MNLGSRYFANDCTLATAGVQQRLRAGAESTTFETQVATLVVLCASHDVYLAKTSGGVVGAAGGGENDRILIQADQHQVQIPWFSDDVWMLNKNGGETPTVGVIGLP